MAINAKIIDIVINDNATWIVIMLVINWVSPPNCLASEYDDAAVGTAAMSHTFAKQFGADEQLMTSIVTTQVALSFITIPIILALITT